MSHAQHLHRGPGRPAAHGTSRAVFNLGLVLPLVGMPVACASEVLDPVSLGGTGGSVGLPTWYCGNGICESPESPTTCPEDCGTCGDGTCDSAESLSSCPEDCRRCGNGSCDLGENAANCDVDCYCGNGSCEEEDEDFTTCPQDHCTCGDGMCDSWEFHSSCPADCRAVGIAVLDVGAFSYAYVVVADGTVREGGWGNGIPPDPSLAGLQGVVGVAVSGHEYHAADGPWADSGHFGCALRADGTVLCGGGYQFLNPGGSYSGTWDLAEVTDIANVTLLTGGGMICAADASGLAACTPGGGFAEVDLADVATAHLSSQYGGGGEHGCALLRDATVWCWGEGSCGQLGDGTLDSRPAAVAVPGMTAVASVALTDAHVCAAREDGTVWCWGANPDGGLGAATPGQHCQYEYNPLVDCSPTPVQAVGVTNATSVAVGDAFSCALRTDGKLWCWGGPFGLTPKEVQGIDDVSDVTADGWTICAVKGDGTAWCWTAGEDPVELTGW